MRFASNLYGDSNVISGIRKDSEVYIYIDMLLTISSYTCLRMVLYYPMEIEMDLSCQNILHMLKAPTDKN